MNEDILKGKWHQIKGEAKSRWGKLTDAWQEWAQLLRMLTPAQVGDFLESTTPKANRLRQSSPFFGVLEEADKPIVTCTDAA